MRRNRSSFTFPDFSLRRLLLQARAARGSPTLGNRCDIEKGASSSSKADKSNSNTSSSKVGCNFFFLLKLCKLFSKEYKLFFFVFLFNILNEEEL